MGLYDVDFHQWLLAQADAIRRRSANELDWENLAEEVESLGRSERRGLKKRLALIVSHLLKWEHQPHRRGRSWQRTVRDNRVAIPLILRDNPSFTSDLQDTFIEAYALGRREAATDMDMEDGQLPEEPPFTLEQVLDSRYPPGLAAWEPRRRR